MQLFRLGCAPCAARRASIVWYLLSIIGHSLSPCRLLTRLLVSVYRSILKRKQPRPHYWFGAHGTSEDTLRKGMQAIKATPEASKRTVPSASPTMASTYATSPLSFSGWLARLFWSQVLKFFLPRSSIASLAQLLNPRWVAPRPFSRTPLLSPCLCLLARRARLSRGFLTEKAL